MELSNTEIKIMTPAECKSAINSILQKTIVYNGRVDVAKMERSQIDYAIHLLRYYRAMAHESSRFPEGVRFTVASAA